MSEQEAGPIKGLPENAYTELKEGEVYKPIMSPTKVYPEVNFRSVFMGLLMSIIFFRCCSLPGSENRTGIRSRNPHCHHCSWCVESFKTQKCIG